MYKNLFVLFAAAVMFTGCKKCYDCTLSDTEYCIDVTINSATTTQCYDTESERDLVETATTLAGGTFNSYEQSTTVGTQSLCGKKSETDDFVSLWETAGYICTEQ